MKIEVKQKVKKTVEETVTLNLTHYWVVKIVRKYDFPCPEEIIREYKFSHEPEAQEIGNCLAEYIEGGSNIYASVIKNYKFKEL